MIARASAVVDAYGRLSHVASSPPLTVRRVYAEEGVGLCLVGSAAGPLAGDELDLELQVQAGAQATLVAAGATLAQGGTSELRTRVSVGPGASLRADPGPLVVAAGACVHVALTIALEPTASIEWRELLVLGRSGEAPGAATIDWDITCGGTPLLRQTVDLTDTRLNSWPGMLRGKRVLATTFRAGPALAARTAVRSPMSVIHRVSDHAELSTEIGDDTSRVLGDLRA